MAPILYFGAGADDVDIAMGTGADVAIESAGIALVQGNLKGVVHARRLAQGRSCDFIGLDLHQYEIATEGS